MKQFIPCSCEHIRHERTDDMDYESITEHMKMEAELINPAERQEDEESNNLEVKKENTRCDWNYVYDEIV